ncbi:MULTISPECIES: hypothetical protein [Burkholderia]|uniref:hypothetical protein n=1 Tax=Burkholderia TaxID=32008 RepID=UPI000980B316|nr:MULTISPECIES: hypothetical protein [Burkholderia]AQQ40285.1 hypothetical protein A8E75_14535 [Burkholderia cenocepacia]MBG0880093.1 hypothetical protein [Burkholderia sp. 9775_39]MBG0887545.1 hypothetical protein [Burkholderia sp. 9773_38]ONV27022.1 hypothetical protein A8E77_25225 [Burkholderia cenocepacia]ONV34260.1 hypothetical protein A8E78_10650 [Burkholderia cenocepacia]
MKRGAVSRRVTGLAIAAWLAAAAAPVFARGQPQLPDDDGGRASVLRALNPEFDPHRHAVDPRPAHTHAAPISRAPSAIPRAAIDALAAR